MSYVCLYQMRIQGEAREPNEIFHRKWFQELEQFQGSCDAVRVLVLGSVSVRD